MRTYLTDIIPKIQRFSKRLDDLTTLTNQHWVIVDELMSSKSVYSFRSNGELLISFNGKVKKTKWEYLGNNSLLIDKINESYLFKHGFLDSNILALKVDSKNEYAFLVNENRYEGELNTFENIIDFLRKNYLEKKSDYPLKEKIQIPIADKEADTKNTVRSRKVNTKKGELEILTKLESGYTVGDTALLNGKPAPDGKYSTGWPSWIDYMTIENGKIKRL